MGKPTTLSIDIETFSSVDLSKSGLYKYAEGPDFEILLFSYAFDYGEVITIDLANKETLTLELIEALLDPAIIKTAWNAAFEFVCISRYLDLELDITQWRCTRVLAASLGLPMSLKAAAKVIGSKEQKDTAGTLLIKYFSVPCKPTKVNEGRTRNMPWHDWDKWHDYKSYNNQDVKSEMAIAEYISWHELPGKEWRLWFLDQEINARGVLVEMDLVEKALALNDLDRADLIHEAEVLTGLENVNSPAQVKEWLSKMAGDTIDSLTKGAVGDLIKKYSHIKPVKRMLEIRQELSKTSIKKYVAMQVGACADTRIRGLFQFYGASGTGRWSGRLVQLQNLVRNSLEDLDLARQIVLYGNIEYLRILFGIVSDVLSQLIRTALIAKPGTTLTVSDFSAIEARVLAWLANEKWRLDVFKKDGGIYEASASKMFHVPVESIVYKDKDGKKQQGPNYHLRQQGKVAELALGFGGGPNALMIMDSGKALNEDELPKIVKMWRNASPAIPKLWAELEKQAIHTVRTGEPTTAARGLIRFTLEHNILFCRLPSGRRLSYMQPHISPNRFDSDGLFYMGASKTTNQWSQIDTYGGKLTENIVQAIARDCLAEAMLAAAKAGFHIVATVHDEIITEDIPGRLSELVGIMSTKIPWAPGLPLKAEGYETNYYLKK